MQLPRAAATPTYVANKSRPRICLPLLHEITLYPISNKSRPRIVAATWPRLLFAAFVRGFCSRLLFAALRYLVHGSGARQWCTAVVHGRGARQRCADSGLVRRYVGT